MMKKKLKIYSKLFVAITSSFLMITTIASCKTGPIEPEIEHPDISHKHRWDENWTIDKEPTCTEEGSKSHHCLDCDFKKDITIIPPKGHSWSEWVSKKDPTCTHKGTSERNCLVCNKVETKEIPINPQNHIWEENWTIDIEPTCTKNGEKSHHCLECDLRKDITLIDKLGHSWSEWIITKEPQVGIAGEEKRTCSVCGEVETRILDPLPEIPNPEIDENFSKYNPYFPVDFTDTPYTRSAPSLNDRFILSEDKSIATIFAPDVTKTSGFYDVNKNFVDDSHLCWAAVCSNMITWYLDRLEKMNVDLTGITRDLPGIFDKFRKNRDDLTGYDPMQGFAWYFTGKTLTGGTPPELLNPNSGGYLKDLPNVGDTWSVLDPVNHYPIVGNYSIKYPFLDDNLTYDKTIDSFSKNVINQLHYGPVALMIVKASASAAGSHAITLWGCDFDTKTGVVKKIYITDSDDEAYQAGTWLREIKMVPNYDGTHGIKMSNYTLPVGDASPYVYITAGTNLFSPDVVKLK